MRPAPHRVLRFFVFVAVEFHQPGSFSGLTPGGQGFRDLFYFSYVTILTIGYGDITPHYMGRQERHHPRGLDRVHVLTVVAMIVNQFAENRTLKRQKSPPFRKRQARFRVASFREAIDRMGSGRKKRPSQSEGHPYRLLLRHGGRTVITGHGAARTTSRRRTRPTADGQTARPCAHDDEAGSFSSASFTSSSMKAAHKNDSRGIHPGELFRQEAFMDFWMVSLGLFTSSAGC